MAIQHLPGLPPVAVMSAATAVVTGPPPCNLLNADGSVRDNATYAWTLRNLTVDTAPTPMSSGIDDPIGPRNVSFVLSTPALDLPVRCQGARFPPHDDVWQTWVTASMCSHCCRRRRYSTEQQRRRTGQQPWEM